MASPPASRIAIVLGTRPEIIKLSPVMRVLDRERVPYFVVHSNQHYSEEMDRVFFEELALPPAAYHLGIGSAEHGNQTGRMLVAIERILLDERPRAVIAQGDTNTVLAAILAASKQGIRCGHLEAGLRSYDRGMPEEKNRVICDAIADELYCPTEVQRGILLGEGVDSSRIHVTGNTIVDAVHANRELAMRSDVLDRLGLRAGRFVLVTAHRASNADTEASLRRLCALLGRIEGLCDCPVVYPVHPRTRARLEQFGLAVDHVRMTRPLGYRDFLRLEADAKLIVTDSGGVQEEACILGVPCVTLRENTERPETVTVGANRLVGLDPTRFDDALAHFFAGPARSWQNPLGDGRAAERVCEILCAK